MAIFKNRFHGGIHPEYFKGLSNRAPVEKLDLPPQVVIPLAQHVGSPASAIVKAGDAVKAGTLIAKSEKFISSYIHSSLSGTVKAVKKSAHPVLGRHDSVIIESDGRDEAEAYDWAKDGVNTLSQDGIREIVREAGIVGLGGAAFPAHVKLTPPREKKIDMFILNGAECEPYLTCDERVMIERAGDILKGALLIMKAVGIEKGIVALEDNKPEAVKSMRSALADLNKAGSKQNRRMYTLELKVLHTKYPQGGEKQLIKALLNREVPPQHLPFDVGCIVDNVQTALAVYEAVYNKRPLYERVITVTGDAINRPANLLVKVGTPVSYIIDRCGGLKEDAAKIIFGGPMMGIAQYDKDAPVIKGTSGILILSEKSARIKAQGDCIRCGKCVEVCPMRLVPTMIANAAERGRADIANEYNVSDCIECGCCSYVCPSNIALAHLIRHAKKGLLCAI